MARYIESYTTKKQVEFDVALHNLEKPYVAYASGAMDYNSIPVKEYATLITKYFTIIPEEDFEFSWPKLGDAVVEYSLDDGSTWAEMTSATTVALTTSDKLLLRGNNDSYENKGFSITDKRYSVEGNIMSIIDTSNFSTQPQFKGPGAFRGFFSGNSVTSAESLILPAKEVYAQTYNLMFQKCTSLTSAPIILTQKLNGTTVFTEMFSGCTALTSACIDGVAIINQNTAFRAMFNGCTSLRYIRCLSVTASGTGIFNNWVKSVAASGTFVKDPGATFWTTGVAGIPSGWTVVDYTYE